MSLADPLFLTRRERSREADAIDRDMRDAERLDAIEQIIVATVVMLGPDAFDLEHPHSRWTPLDLVADLAAAWGDIQRERANLRGPVVIEDEDVP